MFSSKRSLMVVFGGLVSCLVVCAGIWPQTHGEGGVPLATQDRVRNPGWWPTKGTPSRSEYVGPAACAQCHALKVNTQKTTPMAHAATPAADAEILRQHNPLTFVSGAYRFGITETAEGSVYSVNDGTNSLSARVDWAFGNGEVGQTYVYQHDGNFYESRVSFYPTIQALDLTLGHHAPVTNNLANALGRNMPAAEVRLCFGCHTTASTTNDHFNMNGLMPGVTCEACHGPGAKHVEAMQRKQGRLASQTTLNPAKLNPVDAVDFCGACHRTAWDVVLTNTVGVANVRFQPYRLEKSRCWGKGDGRLTCMACHDPHVPLVRDPTAYDAQCLTCHLSKSSDGADASNHPGKACPVETSKCVTCHMAKYEIPGSHAKFTDHWIRVVKGNDYPD